MIEWSTRNRNVNDIYSIDCDVFRLSDLHKLDKSAHMYTCDQVQVSANHVHARSGHGYYIIENHTEHSNLLSAEFTVLFLKW